MSQVGRVIDPDIVLPTPVQSQTTTRAPRAKKIGYSPPIRRLVDEHGWIKRLLGHIPDVVNEIRESEEVDSDLLPTTLEFINSYVDRFHQLKEESILFDYTDRTAEIVRVISEDHDRARGLVHATVRAVRDGNSEAVCGNLMDYRALVTEHITKEDNTLYPYVDRGLTISQVGEMFRRFEDYESGMLDDVPCKYEQFVSSLAGRLPGKDAVWTKHLTQVAGAIRSCVH